MFSIFSSFRHRTFWLLFCVAICELAGIAGSFFTAPAVSSSWYANLQKPVFMPPSWVFGPVWVTLYFLMGVSLYFIWKQAFSRHFLPFLHEKSQHQARFSIVFFFVHLALNAAWSIVFFGLQNIALALAVIGILWLMILVLIALFSSLDKRSSWLLVPYFLWVSFAAVLNAAIFVLN